MDSVRKAIQPANANRRLKASTYESIRPIRRGSGGEFSRVYDVGLPGVLERPEVRPVFEDRSWIGLARRLRQGVLLKVKIGIVDADRVVEIETDDPDALRLTVDTAFASGVSILWFEDTKKRLVGIPRDKLAFVEIEQESDSRSVGFARASG